MAAKARARLDELARDLPEHEQHTHTHTLAHDLEQALAREQTAQSRFGTASAEEARARDNHDRLHAQLEAGRALLDAHPGADDVERTRHDAEQATHADQEARAEQARLEREHEQLSAGRSPRPPGLEAFQSVLAEHGIESALLADLLEVEHETAAEAALGDGVWALVVNDARYEQALALAEQHSHRLPIVRAGEGAPRGVFAGATGLEQALAYLGELDRPLGDRPGHVSERGRVRGEHWAAYRAPARPALGEKARQHAITQIEARLADLTRELPLFAQRAEELRTRAETIAAAARAASALPAAAKRLREGEIELTEAKNGLAELTGSSAELGEELGRVKSVLDQLRREHAEVEAGLPRQEADALSATRRVSELESELATAPLTPEQAALDSERSREQLEGEHIVLDEQLARFSEEEQSPAIVAEVADQEQRLQRAQEMVAGKRELLDRVEDVAREAKRRYDGHVRQTIDRLNASFREICERADMKGELELRPSLTNDEEFALEARVALNRGDAMISYLDSAHSGGERAKISVLLLLAAMSSEGAADLLVMDEHTAHLDSNNIDVLGELMRTLRGHVQFILATPANAEALRLDWADHELIFFKRQEGEHYAPPIQILTREPEYQPPLDERQLEIAH